MRYLKNFGLFWYDFVIGDDWTIAAAVVVALAVIGLLAHEHVAAWWIMLLVVLAFLGVSLTRASNSS